MPRLSYPWAAVDSGGQNVYVGRGAPAFVGGWS